MIVIYFLVTLSMPVKAQLYEVDTVDPLAYRTQVKALFRVHLPEEDYVKFLDGGSVAFPIEMMDGSRKFVFRFYGNHIDLPPGVSLEDLVERRYKGDVTVTRKKGDHVYLRSEATSRVDQQVIDPASRLAKELAHLIRVWIQNHPDSEYGPDHPLSVVLEVIDPNKPSEVTANAAPPL